MASERTKWLAGDQVFADLLNDNFGLIFSDDVDITYDNRNRIATIINNDLVTPETYTLSYDSQSRIISVTDGVNTWTATYDLRGRVTNIIRTP